MIRIIQIYRFHNRLHFYEIKELSFWAQMKKSKGQKPFQVALPFLHFCGIQFAVP